MISNIKDLPTDNLYKFMAIFGMLLIILPFLVFPTIQNYKYRIIDLTTKAALKDNELKELEKIVKQVEDKTSQLNKEEHIKNYENEFDVNKSREVNEVEKTVKDVFKKIEIGEIESINLNNELKKVVADFNYFAILIYIIKVFPIIGFIISIIGFYLWYNKNQKYLDIIIKKESEK
ncbi:MAG: hypothetical protein KBE24_01960 [Fusobacteriaceae bacterium]|nr:hypothetical protein [Fusobacteriaceae bacterium]MBP9595523.1 hypothetical protein [Fusobacteriaceae bacterium]MBU9918794.1 hypothetical protein [Fusobacteriaceae bacterium]